MSRDLAIACEQINCDGLLKSGWLVGEPCAAHDWCIRDWILVHLTRPIGRFVCWRAIIARWPTVLKEFNRLKKTRQI